MSPDAFVGCETIIREELMADEDRNINNNPTGDPFCCHPECNDDAALNIANPPFGLEDTTQSCEKGDHVTYLLEPGGLVTPIDA